MTTIKNRSIGTKTAVKAYVDPEGSTYEADSGSYAYYAGPATLRAPGCTRWGGSVGSSTWGSALSHCG